MQRWLNERWYGASAPLALQPFAWLYGAAVAARRGWVRAEEVGAPVVIVGNLTVGGTGKTPLVAWLAGELGRRGFTVGLVARGYGGATAHTVRILHERSRWQEVGDEPLILQRHTGCVMAVGHDRVAAARALVARAATVILADDGLQHLSLARHCAIVVADGARGFGNGRLLPAGPLREPPGRLAAADALVVNGPIEHASLKRAAERFDGPLLQMTLRAGPARRLASLESRPLEAFRGTPVHAVAGIGNPGRFFRELRARGLEVLEHPFPDHHALRTAELDFGDEQPVLMTEKDAVKCPVPADRRLWFVPVEAALDAADAHRLGELVQHKIESFASPGG